MVAILLVSGGAGGSGVRWHLCSGCAERVADGLPFYTRRLLRWVASWMLMVMSRYNPTGGSDAFMRVFSCAGALAGAGTRGEAATTGRMIEKTMSIIDISNDGFVTVNDIRLTGAGLESPPTCLGDLNNDGFVNFGDALVIIANWGSMPIDIIQDLSMR
jgi:hypothetical protein